MSNENQPATMRELKAACPGADNDFLVAQIEAGARVGQARIAWMAEQNKRLEATRQKAATAKRRDTQGVRPVVTRAAIELAGEYDDPIQEFNSAVCELMNSQRIDRHQAIAAVVMKNPQLHKEFLLASNPNRQSRRLIEEKYATE